jgi:hypothetical protein
MTDVEQALRTRLHEIAETGGPVRGPERADLAIDLWRRTRRRTAVGFVVVGVLLLGVPAVVVAAQHTAGSPDGGVVASSTTGSSSAPAEETRPEEDSVPPGQPPTPGTGPTDPQVGVAYEVDFYSHCGISTTVFGGRGWQAVSPQPEPDRRPDGSGIGSYTGYTSGVMTLLSEDRLRFTITDPLSSGEGQSFDFEPLPEAAQPPPCD